MESARAPHAIAPDGTIVPVVADRTLAVPVSTLPEIYIDKGANPDAHMDDPMAH